MTSTVAPSPPPLDDPTVSDPLQCPPLRWGIVGCGRVSNDFTQALKYLPSATVVACAARREEGAKAFAETHGIKKYYGSYDSLLQDPEVQCVYVGNIHKFRRETGEKCLKANKHVLIEKPLACTVADAKYLIGLARDRNLFLMEGMWTRFFPAVEKARQLALGDENGIGDVVSVKSDFNFNAEDTGDSYPNSFYYDRGLGGGASFQIASYPIAAACLFFRGASPNQVEVAGLIDEETGVDLQASMILSFPANESAKYDNDLGRKIGDSPQLYGAGIANLSIGILSESDEVTEVTGTKGRLVIESPAHCPTKLRVILKGAADPGKAETDYTYEFPLPPDLDEVTKSGGFNYPNSVGFMYEAAAVARCIASGKKEVPQYKLDETMLTMKLLEELRLQLGVERPPQPRTLLDYLRKVFFWM